MHKEDRERNYKMTVRFEEARIMSIMQDWKSGKKTHGEIKKSWGLTDAQEYAITWAADKGYTSASIFEKLPKVNSNMKAAVIEKVMTF